MFRVSRLISAMINTRSHLDNVMVPLAFLLNNLPFPLVLGSSHHEHGGDLDAEARRRGVGPGGARLPPLLHAADGRVDVRDHLQARPPSAEICFNLESLRHICGTQRFSFFLLRCISLVLQLTEIRNL